ncbi:MAG: M20/M25/M40 family metallo-hydrolase, partial [Chloroflexi bacterium]
MSRNVVELTAQLVAIQSETPQSNRPVSDFLKAVLEEAGFAVEVLSYIDPNGEEKVNLVGKKGGGAGGLGLFSHSDTVPGNVGWQPFAPEVKDGKLYGRGSCDMKGPLAATIVAASRFPAEQLTKPLFIAVTSDEENGHIGSHFIVAESKTLTRGWPEFCVVCEPSEMIPVYAHKGGARVTVTAHGRSAHTSTDKGESANFKIAPFLAEMAELAQLFKTDKRFQNDEFNPPTNGFNLILNDGGVPLNVTAAKTVAGLGLRAMPNAGTEEAIQMIVERAKAHNLEVEISGTSFSHFHVSPDSPLVQAACRATGAERAVTVPYGTEAVTYQSHMQSIVLGPGNIAQAHTVGEFIDIAQLEEAVEVYSRLIE